ncbi:RmlC-like jelly roll fold protein [Coleophoma crateriformis]|uniref:RmlC-like jelly roll fold protein n=1 Tax=Coleophoma crateriformis TaxID=565419 RepID=A0A3D8Q9K8_9HELO|nr:RmlC-like jelly roll fold protein [Coleophoma crateriformis]
MDQKEFSNPPPRPGPSASLNPESVKPWTSIGPGIWELVLNSAGDVEKSVLQWYEPGAKSVTDDIITHTYIEEVVYLEGGLKDVTLGQEWGPGAYAYRKPGMEHGPYIASSKGCYQFCKFTPVDNRQG